MRHTAHVDTFARDNLPPRTQWPLLRFDAPGLAYPDALNCAICRPVVAFHRRTVPSQDAEATRSPSG